MKSPYKIKHWSPVKKVPKSIDGWGNVLEWELVDADEYGDEDRHDLQDRIKKYKTTH